MDGWMDGSIRKSSITPHAASSPSPKPPLQLLPWGDTSKGLWAGKRDAMVEKYMERTGCSKEVRGLRLRG